MCLTCSRITGWIGSGGAHETLGRESFWPVALDCVDVAAFPAVAFSQDVRTLSGCVAVIAIPSILSPIRPIASCSYRAAVIERLRSGGATELSSRAWRFRTIL